MAAPRRVMWNGTVRSLPLSDQLKATALAGCEALSVTPSDCVRWLASTLSTRDMLAMAEDAGVRITHLDPWSDGWTTGGLPYRRRFSLLMPSAST